MIAHLRGSIHRLDPGEVSVDVQGVGYRVTVPLDAWDTLDEGSIRMLWISTYIREDRMDLFGFSDRAGRTLFEELIKKQGIGPKLALELCAVPRSMLITAIQTQDESLLTSIKGIGKKTAEKLLIELRSMIEQHPGIFGDGGPSLPAAGYDQDAVAALASLGYDTPTILQTLKELPTELQSTEERVAAALRNL